MSSWSEIRARSGDPLSDSIADLVSRANMAEAITDQITVSDKISHVKILRSKITVTDEHLFSAYARPRNPNQKYYMPLEPDGNKVRMDMKFDHGGETLTDYAYMGNQIEIGYDTEQPKLDKNPEDDGVTPGELVSTLDGKQHYYRVPRTSKNSIKQMVTDGEDGFSLTVRVWYITVVNENLSGGSSMAHICYYIENDQVEYALKIYLDDNAFLHAFLKMDDEYFYLKSTAALFTPTDLADFDSENFNPDDFDTGITEVPVPEVIPFMDLAMTFDFTSKELILYKDGVIIAQSYKILSLSDLPTTTGLKVWYKLDEASGEIAYDSSGNAININWSGIPAAAKPIRVIHKNKPHLYFDDYPTNQYIFNTFSPVIPTVTQWTLSFFLIVRPDFFTTAHSKVPVYFTGSSTQRVLPYIQTSSRNLSMDITNSAGVTRFIPLMPNAFPTNNPDDWTAYHVAITYDGTKYQAYVDKVAGPTTNLFSGDQWTNVVNMGIGRATSLSLNGIMSHVMFYEQALSESQIGEIYDNFMPTVQAEILTNQGVQAFRQTSIADIPDTTGLACWFKINEGNNTAIIDYSGKGVNGVVNSLGVSASWQPDGTLKSEGIVTFAGTTITRTNDTDTDALTEFTVAFWIKVDNVNGGPASYYRRLFEKGWQADGSFVFYRSPGSPNIVWEQRADNTVKNSVTLTDAFPDINKWYFIVVRWKTGETIKISEGRRARLSQSVVVSQVYTENQPLKILGGTPIDGTLKHFMFFKRQIADAEVDALYDNFKLAVEEDTNPPTTEELNAIFPPPFDDPDPPPPPGTPYTEPFTNVMNQSTENASVKINKVTTSNLVEVYNVAGGTPESNPFQNKYTVPEGSGSQQTNPYASPPFYDMAGASSTGNMVFADDEIAYGQYIRTTASALNGKKLTRLTLEMNNQGSPQGGTVYLGIIKANGQTIKFGAGIAVSALQNDWTSYTRTGNQDIPTQYTLAVGDGVGVIWEGGTGGTVNIRRTGSNVHQASENGGANSCQAQYVSGVGWDNINSQWAMAAVMETGGEVVSTTPWITMDKTTNLIVGEQFSNSSLMYNNAPTKLEWKVYKKAGTTGILTLAIFTAAGAVKTNGILKTWNIATELPDTAPGAGVFNLTWENILNLVTVGSGERICLSTPASGTGTMNTGGELYVLSNNNNNAGGNNYNGSSSYIVKRNSSGSWATVSTALDISGNIWIGGNDYTGYTHLNDTRKRVGIKADTATSSLVTPEPGKIVTNVEITAKKWNNPTDGAIYCRIRSGAGVLRATIGQKDISQVLATDTSLEFTNVDNTYPMDTDDCISIEYDGGTATDYLMVRDSKNAFEGTDTIMFETFASDLTQTLPVTDRDLAAIVSTGGQIDTTARPRRGIKINAGSALIGDPITEARLKLKRTGAFGAGEEMSVKIIRGSDKVTVATLDTKELNTISDTAFVEYIFQNTGNSYPMTEGDFIAIENNFGNSTTAFIEARISSTNAFDGTATCMFEWNGTAYTDVSAADLTVQLFVGGFMVFPDPNVPVDPTPHHYYHGWFIFAATSPDSNAEIDPYYLKPQPYSYSHCMPKQLRLFAMVLTKQQLINYFTNRFTTTPIGFGQTEIVGNDISGYDDS